MLKFCRNGAQVVIVIRTNRAEGDPVKFHHFVVMRDHPVPQNTGHPLVGDARKPRQLVLFYPCDFYPFLHLHSVISISDRKKLSMTFSGL